MSKFCEHRMSERIWRRLPEPSVARFFRIFNFSMIGEMSHVLRLIFLLGGNYGQRFISPDRTKNPARANVNVACWFIHCLLCCFVACQEMKIGFLVDGDCCSALQSGSIGRWWLIWCRSDCCSSQWKMLQSKWMTASSLLVSTVKFAKEDWFSKHCSSCWVCSNKQRINPCVLTKLWALVQFWVFLQPEQVESWGPDWCVEPWKKGCRACPHTHNHATAGGVQQQQQFNTR